MHSFLFVSNERGCETKQKWLAFMPSGFSIVNYTEGNDFCLWNFLFPFSWLTMSKLLSVYYEFYLLHTTHHSEQILTWHSYLEVLADSCIRMCQYLWNVDKQGSFQNAEDVRCFSGQHWGILVRASCVRCPWALQAKIKCFFSLLSLSLWITFLPEGGSEIVNGRWTHK